MKRGKFYFTISLFIAFVTVPTLYLHSQSTLSIGMNHARPQADLLDSEYQSGYGFYMEVLSPRKRTNFPLDLQVGGHFDVNFHGDRSYTTNLPYPLDGTEEYNLANESIALSGMARLITSDRFRVQFYADGILGSRVFYTNEGTHQDDFEDCPPMEVVNRSWTFLYGASGGMMVQLTPYTRLDLRATYTQGSNASFVNLNSVTRLEQNAFNYKIGRSATQMIQFQIGVNFDIRESACGGGSSDDDFGVFGFSSCGN